MGASERQLFVVVQMVEWTCGEHELSVMSTFSVKQLVHGETRVTAVSLQSSRAHVFVDVWLQRDCKR